MSIRVSAADVRITEQTVRELLRAIETAKEKVVELTSDPMPEMSEEDYWREMRRRGTVRISSGYSKITFVVDLETKPHTQESLGYILEHS